MTRPEGQLSQMPLDLPKPPTPPTRPQGKKALAMLEAAKWRGVGGGDFIRAYIAAYSQEVGRLQKRGYQIVRHRRDGDAATARYWLAQYFDPEREG